MAMASNGVPGNDGVTLKKRKAVSASARTNSDQHEDQDVALPLSAIKKSKRASTARHESEFVNVEVGMRELHKRLASSSTTPEKAAKKRTPTKKNAAPEPEPPVSSGATKKASTGRKRIPIAIAEDDTATTGTPTVAKTKRKASAVTEAATSPAAVRALQPRETPVKTAKRTTTPTKRTATMAAAAAGERAPKRTVKARTAPAKSVLDTLAQARAAAMQQQQERIQQRIRGLAGATTKTPTTAQPAVLQPTAIQQSPALVHRQPQPPTPATVRAPAAVPVAQTPLSPTPTVAAAPRVVAPVVVSPPPLALAEPLVATQESQEPSQSQPSSSQEQPPSSQQQESSSSQGFIEDENFDEDLAFLQALEEVERKLQPAPIVSSSPPMQTPVPILSPLVRPMMASPVPPIAMDKASTDMVSPSMAPASASPTVNVLPPNVAEDPLSPVASAPKSPPVRPTSPVAAPVAPERAASPAAEQTPAIPPEILAEFERLKRENEALRRSNEQFQAGQAVISAPPSPAMAPAAAVDVVENRVEHPPASLLPSDNAAASSKDEADDENVSTITEGQQEHHKVDQSEVVANVEIEESAVVIPSQTETMEDQDDRQEVDVVDVVADGELEVDDDEVDIAGGEIVSDEDEDEDGADDQDEDDDELDSVPSVEQTHESTIDRGNYSQYRAKDELNADDDDVEDAQVVSTTSSRATPTVRLAPRTATPQVASATPAATPTTVTSSAAPPQRMHHSVDADGSETESDEEQHRRRRSIALAKSSSSSSEDSEEEEEQNSSSNTGSNVLEAALRAATGKAPAVPVAKSNTKKSIEAKPQSEKRARAVESIKEEATEVAPSYAASPSPSHEPSTKRAMKKRRATTTTLSAKDKSTLLWPSLDDFYDFVLDLTPRRVLHSDPLRLQLLRAYEKARARLPMQYPGLVQYCDVQLEAILEELLASVRNAEELSLYNSTRARLWLTSISPCSNNSSHTNTVMNAASSSSSTASLNPNVIFMESGFSGTSAAGKNDYIVTFQDHRTSANQKSALSDFVGGDLLALRSPQWRNQDIYAFGIVLCSSVVAVGGAASSSSSSSGQDQLCVLLRAPSPSEDDPDAGSRFASIMEMCLVNQRSAQWSWSMDQVHNLTTSAREFQAIKSVRLFKPETKEMIMSGIIPEIVKTEQTQIIEPRKKLSTGLYEELEGKYNPSQLQAILGSISDGSAISIIQGPPGTGKTKTILGVLSALLDGAALSASRQAQVKSRIRVGASLQQNSSKSPSSNSSTGGNNTKSVAQSTIRILVAAPSNAAVDELIVRLISEGVFDARQGKAYRPRIVRVGRPESQQQTSSSDRQHDSKSQDVLRKKKWRKYASEVEEILLENLVNKHKSSFPTAKQARQSIIQNAQIVFCTLSGAGSVAMCELQSQHFDALVIDEAAQAVEASLLIPFKFQPGRIVLVGDHRQLPATVISKRLIDLGYDRSLFQRFVENGSRVFMLLQQYRMHPEISWFPSTYFYNGKLVEAPQMKDWTARKYHRETLFRPFVFYDVLLGKQSQVNGSKSLRNVNEIECILVLLTRLVVEQFPELEWRRKIGIIAPYKQQIHELRNELQRWEKKHDKKLEIEVNTVDGFQGREKEVIIYSCVRTSRGGQNRNSNRQSNGQTIEAFWADERRMNVAITRAKSSLWIIGNSTLLQQSEAWRALITHAKDSRRYMLEEDITGTKPRESDTSRSQSQSRSHSRSRSRADTSSREGDRRNDRTRTRSRSPSRPRDRRG